MSPPPPQSTGSWQSLDTECRLEGGGSTELTRLVVIEDQVENDCLVKYIQDEFGDSTAKTYAIGVKMSDQYKGVYEWNHVTDDEHKNTLKFNNWAAAEPTGKTCATMDIAEGLVTSGLWKGADCSTPSTIYAICEKVTMGQTVENPEPFSLFVRLWGKKNRRGCGLRHSLGTV